MEQNTLDVSFIVQPRSGYVPMSVFFQNTSPVTSGVSYVWDFGDGVTMDATDLAAFHGYDNPGTYQISLSAIDSAGRTGMATDIINLHENVEVEAGYSFSAASNVESIESVPIRGSTYSAVSSSSESAIVILGALVAGFVATYFLYKHIKRSK